MPDRLLPLQMIVNVGACMWPRKFEDEQDCGSDGISRVLPGLVQSFFQVIGNRV